MPQPTSAAHSADVDLWLECEHGRFPLAQVAQTFVVPASPQNIPACKARVIVVVDGRRYVHDVNLINGLSPGDASATILADDAAAPF